MKLNSYKGYLKEVFIYSTYIVRPKRIPSTKFVIFGYGRSGSNLLVDLLNSHPYIYCNYELWGKKVFFPKLYIKCCEALTREDVYGFKLLSSHFEIQGVDNPLEYMMELNNKGYKIISIKRRNILRQALSVLYAVNRKKFHHKRIEGVQEKKWMNVDMDKLLTELRFIDRLNELEEQILKELPYLRLFYEDDLIDGTKHQITVDKISDFLGITNARVKTDLVKTTPDDLSDFVENLDDLKGFIGQTKYSGYLEN